MRVVVDTNIWISFLIGKLLTGLKSHILSGKVEIVTTHEQIEEINAVVRRPKFSKYFNDEDIEELLFLVFKTSRFIKIEKKIEDCRDKKDNSILEIAAHGKVDYIVTGDRDLTDLDPYNDIRIITYHEFDNVLKALSS